MYKKLLFCFVGVFTMAFFSAQAVDSNGVAYNIVYDNITGTEYAEVGNNEYYSGALVLPNSVNYADVDYPVTSISAYAFFQNKGLTSIKIGNSIKSIGNGAFQGCAALTTVIIDDSVLSIGSSAFDSCLSLTSVNIPNKLSIIENYTFNACVGLTSITIPNSVTSIGQQAFGSCSGLTSVKCFVETPLLISSNVFQNLDQSKCTLSVPSASVAAYQAADVWKAFNPIVAIANLGTIENITKNNVILYPNPIHNEAILEIKNSENSNLEVYDMNGKLVLRKSLNNSKNTINTSNLAKGVYLFKVGNSVTKVIKN